MFLKRSTPKITVCLFLCCWLALPGRTQSVLSGIINQYAAVTAVDTCANTITVAAPAGFRAGGQALLIQMQGATIDTDDSPDFGNITDLGQAGRYEKVVIRSVTGNEIAFENKLLDHYDVNGAVQLVSMPVYNTAVVRNTLQARPWDGAAGGVIALDVRDTLFLEADIDAGGAGFRGGAANIQEDGDCSFLDNIRTFGLPLGDYLGGAKGEGIAKWITGLEAGRGPQANGGGGGNDHNSGGGGGANASAGGRGGRNDEPSFFGCSGAFPGDGGNPAPADTTRLYLGGGGGAGDENNDASTSGGNGGGIVILSARVLSANGFAIRANGQSVATTTGDGGGGGGAGGTVLLHGQILLGALTVEAKGGNGGDIDNRDQARCHGPGGGGGGGRYLGPAAWSPVVDLSGGAAGVSFNSPSAACGNTENLALAGEPGLQQRTNGIRESLIPFAPPEITNLAVMFSACEGGAWEAPVEVEGQNLLLQWQKLEGNTYTDLNAGAPYAGVNSATLRVDPVSAELDGDQYRLKVVTTCGDAFFSEPVDLRVEERPSAAFSFSADELAVAFSNQSAGASSYTWFFGDNAQSTEENPVHTYAAAGSYEAILVARNACGADTLRQTVALSSNVAPQAAFSFEPAGGCTPLQIRFTNQSSGDYTGLAWRFPGGEPATSTEENPLVTYTESGLYAFALVVTGPLGQDELMLEEQIEVGRPPVADFSFTADGLTVTFQNTSADGETYRWLLGDGREDTVENPVHTYAASGSYDVRLITTNECGADTAETTLQVALAPQAGFSFTPTADCAPLRVQFTNESTGDFTNVQWRFPGGEPATSTERNPVVTYTRSGAYTFTLLVSGVLGQDSLVLEQTLEVRPGPAADFNFSADDRTVRFENRSQNGDTFRWLFGDGAEGAAIDPTHTYAAYGSYEVTLVALNACGGDTLRRTVEVGAAPRALYGLEPLGGCAPVQIRFSNRSFGNFTRLEWAFPGGTPASSTDPNPVVRYETPGTYGVRLYVEGPLGADQLEEEAVVEVLPVPEPAFTYEIRGDTLFLQNQSMNARAYRWNFGDGSTSREENPTYVYDRTGVFDVTLNAANAYCGKAVTRRINVVATSTEEALRAAGISLYPNPLTDLLYIDVADLQLFPLRVTLVNSVGQHLQEWMLSAAQSLSLGVYPAGMYYVLIGSEKGNWVGRVVKR